jgi:hypothetical protein
MDGADCRSRTVGLHELLISIRGQLNFLWAKKNLDKIEVLYEWCRLPESNCGLV